MHVQNVLNSNRVSLNISYCSLNHLIFCDFLFVIAGLSRGPAWLLALVGCKKRLFHTTSSVLAEDSNFSGTCKHLGEET